MKVSSYPHFVYIWQDQKVPYQGEVEEYLVYNFAIEKHIEKLKKIQKEGTIERLHSGNEAKLCNLGKKANPKGSALCAIFVLSSSDNLKKQKKQMEIVKQIAKQFRTIKGLEIVYVDWKNQAKTLQKLLVDDSSSVSRPNTKAEDPCLIILRSKRGKVKASVHAFTQESLKNTLERAIGGDLQMKNIPTTVHFK
jgi:hypothetical protein